MIDERIDEEIQKVVNGLLVLPHHVLLRQLTYWSTDIDDGEYGIDPDHGREEWREITDCYATAKTEQQRYMYAGCMALKIGSMLQDIKQLNPNLFQNAVHEVIMLTQQFKGKLQELIMLFKGSVDADETKILTQITCLLYLSALKAYKC